MPPRTRQRSQAPAVVEATAAGSTAPASATTAGFHSLPDSLAASIFSLVGDLRERQRTLPLVCKQWNELALSPQLLRDITVRFRGYFTVDWQHRELGEDVAYFFSWLLGSGAAQHVRQLRLRREEEGYSVNHDLPDGEAVHAFWEALEAGLHGLGLVGVLEELDIYMEVPPALGLPLNRKLTCLGAPPLPVAGHGGAPGSGLRRLHASLLAQDEWHEVSLGVGVRLQDFRALVDLRLTAWRLEWDPTVCLPPSLTSLVLGQEVVLNQWPLFLPPPFNLEQLLAPLTLLCHLGIRGMALEGVDFGVFASTLQRLAMRDCGPLPEAITRLTGLQSLAWENSHQMGSSEANAEGRLSAAAAANVSRLTGLTFLSLMTLDAQPTVLSALAPLSCLSTLCLLPASVKAWPTLPAEGAWMGSVRQLVLDHCSAADSLSALSAMSRLERLCLVSLEDALAEGEGYQSIADDFSGRKPAGGQEAKASLKAWLNAHSSLVQPLPTLREKLQFYATVAQETMARKVLLCY